MTRDWNCLGLWLPLLVVVLGLSVGCGRDTPAADPASANRRTGTQSTDHGKPDTATSPIPTPSLPRIEVNWDPSSGRGDVIHHGASGDRLRTCFHCKYQGYTGGLVIGNESGPGCGFYPKTPIRGYRSINVWCAQDESIWDREEKVEYSYGWSENYGKGSDGARLEYVRGEILSHTERALVLRSENAGGCYRVTKVATTRPAVRWWILATRITNRCDHSITFDFFSGEDPWVGLYRSSDGDVGWTPDGLVDHESHFPEGYFTQGGFYDLGNQALGQARGSFSNQANFLLLDPTAPLPQHVLYANSFAHSAGAIDPKRPLDNKSLSAMNLGWTNRHLEPGEGVTITFAMGMAEVGEPGSVPASPTITDRDWSVWRQYVKENNSVGPGVEFAAERVEIDLTHTNMAVDGLYTLRNPTDTATSLIIRYPILVSKKRPKPALVEVDGKPLPIRVAKGLAEVRFPISVSPRGITRFRVRYQQAHTGRSAAYMVTSARSWPTPIGRAVFIVRHPSTLGRLSASYPIAASRTRGERIEHRLVFSSFLPDRELVFRW